MKKFIDTPAQLLRDSLRGFAAAHAEIVLLHEEPRYLRRVGAPKAGKVALISGGGSGHEPLHAGFVGLGMLDAACPGEIFTSPTPDQIVAAAQAMDTDAGVLFIVKNYAGDVMNFEIAAELFGAQCASVLVNDDVSLPASHSTGRRGVAGTAVVEKMVGAAAEAGADLAACVALAERVIKATASMGVALTSCTVPALGKPTFDIGEDEMEVGVGIHGERGRERIGLLPAAAIAERLTTAIQAELQIASGESILLHINGFGGTPSVELYLMYEHARRLWTELGARIERSLVGSFTTSLDMAGCSLTVTRMDDELLRWWDAPVHTAALRWGC